MTAKKLSAYRQLICDIENDLKVATVAVVNTARLNGALTQSMGWHTFSEFMTAQREKGRVVVPHINFGQPFSKNQTLFIGQKVIACHELHIRRGNL